MVKIYEAERKIEKKKKKERKEGNENNLRDLWGNVKTFQHLNQRSTRRRQK